MRKKGFLYYLKNFKNMKIKKHLSNLGLFIATLMIICIVFFMDYYFKEETLSPLDKENQAETNNNQKSDYPRNLIEGVVVLVETSPTQEIKMTANLDKILLNKNIFQKEVSILVSENTEFFIHDLNSGEENKANIQDLKKGDHILVSISENNENILTQETFVATAIRKLILPLPESNI